MNSAVRKAGKFHVFQQDYQQQAVVATLEVSGVRDFVCSSKDLMSPIICIPLYYERNLEFLLQ